MHRHLATGAVLLLTVALAGCGEKKINSEDLEAKLKTEISKGAGVKLDSVSCPDDIEVKKGKKFDCTVKTENGDELTVNVTLTNEEGRFSYVLPAGQ